MSTPPTVALEQYRPPEPAAKEPMSVARVADWRSEYFREQNRHASTHIVSKGEQNRRQQLKSLESAEMDRPGEAIVSGTHPGEDAHVSDLSWFAGTAPIQRSVVGAEQKSPAKSPAVGVFQRPTTSLRPPPGADRNAELHYRVEPQTLNERAQAEGFEVAGVASKRGRRSLITSSDSGEDRHAVLNWTVPMQPAQRGPSTVVTADVGAGAGKDPRSSHKPSFRVQPSDLDPFGDAETIEKKEVSLSPLDVPSMTNGASTVVGNTATHLSRKSSFRVEPTDVDPFGDAEQIEKGTPLLSPINAMHLANANSQNRADQVGASHLHQQYYDKSMPQPAVILIPSSLVDSLSQSGATTPYYASLNPIAHLTQNYDSMRRFGTPVPDVAARRATDESSTTVGDETMTFSRGATSSTMPLPFKYPSDNEEEDDFRSSSTSNAPQPRRGAQRARLTKSTDKTLGDRANGATGRDQDKSRRLLRHTTDTMERSQQGDIQQSPKSTQQYNRLYRRRQKVVFEDEDDDGDNRLEEPGRIGSKNRRAADRSSSSSRKTRRTQRSKNAAVSEHSGMESTKMHILANPRLLLNVFTFWINLLACHGTAAHNECVHSVLSDLRDHFMRLVSKKRLRAQAAGHSLSAEEEAKIASATEKTQRVLNDLLENLDNRAYDTTHSIVNVVNAVGPYVLRSFLVETQVISLDPYTSDTSTAWAHVIAASDPTLPYGAERKLTDPSEMLRRMAWSKNLTIPGL